MSEEKSELLSAQVILRPASGDSLADAMITSQSAHIWLPTPEVVEQLQNLFAGQGFEVSECYAISFSITASPQQFEEIFQTKLNHDVEKGVQTVYPDRSLHYELPLSILPEDVAQHIEAITFTPPPDFGPTAF